jgi:hypothetical protein
MSSIQILILFFLLMMILMYLMEKCKVVENWELYYQYPYGEIKTCPNVYNGSCSFYNLPRYRKPYMWPAKHLVDYPIKHYQNLDIQMY